jgi:hypothetical protein
MCRLSKESPCDSKGFARPGFSGAQMRDDNRQFYRHTVRVPSVAVFVQRRENSMARMANLRIAKSEQRLTTQP